MESLNPSVNRIWQSKFRYSGPEHEIRDANLHQPPGPKGTCSPTLPDATAIYCDSVQPRLTIRELQRMLAMGMGGLLSWQISSGEITYLDSQ